MKGNFTMIPNEVFRTGKLTPYEIVVYCYLRSRQGGNSHSWPSHARIADDLSISEKKIRTTIASLVAKGLVLKRNRFRPDGSRTSNSYITVTKLPRSLRPPPSVPHAEKEDSPQENSKLNSSSEMSDRVWAYIADDLEPSDFQLEYLFDLVREAYELSADDASEYLAAMGLKTQRDAHEAIQELYGILQRQHMKRS